LERATKSSSLEIIFPTITKYQLTCIFQHRRREAPQRTVAADIFSSSDPLTASSNVFSSSAKLPSNPLVNLQKRASDIPGFSKEKEVLKTRTKSKKLTDKEN
jgi:hypothetical protein